jgi:DNA modification methylase
MAFQRPFLLAVDRGGFDEEAEMAEADEAPPLRLEWREPDELTENPSNWRRHPPQQMQALKDIIAEVGWAGALLYNERTKRLVDGHLRKKVASKDGKVPVLIGSWSEDQERKILLTLDPIAAMAESDKVAIEALLAQVQFSSQSMGPLLEKIAGEAGWQAVRQPGDLLEPAAQIDKAAELQKQWDTALGQIWQIGPNRLACGDCNDEAVVTALFAGARARLVWTDPPYGISYAEKNKYLNRTDRGNRIQREIANDSLPPEKLKELWANALSLVPGEKGVALYATVPSGPLVKVFMEGMESGGFAFKHFLVWVKQGFVIGMADYHYRHEGILYGWREDGAHYFGGDRSQDSVFEVDRPTASDLHSTTKPVELVARMIANSSQVGDVVYDPFSGSGTTLVAAHQLERIGYGCELDPGYAAVTLQRLADLGLKPDLVWEAAPPAVPEPEIAPEAAPAAESGQTAQEGPMARREAAVAAEEGK